MGFRPFGFLTSAVYILLLKSQWVDSAKNGCPILASGKCWVDCLDFPLTHIHQIMCEEVDYFSLHDDIELYKEKIKNLAIPPVVALTIHNSPDLITVERNLLHHLEKHLTFLSLDNLQGLVFLPMLRDFKNLTQLQISKCPKVNELDLTILPASLTSLSIEDTGISRLEYRRDQRAILPNVVDVMLHQNSITFIQGGFFRSFPAMTSLYMNNNQFSIDDVDEDVFGTTLPLIQVYFSSNDFDRCSDEVKRLFFQSIVNSLTLDDKHNRVDLTNNHLIISAQAAANFSRLNQVTILLLRGNTFDTKVQTSEMFATMSKLLTLDVGSTHFKPSNGVFKNLRALHTLHLDSNALWDSSTTDIFKDLGSETLSTVNLANNGLRTLPTMSFAKLMPNIESLDLSGNKMEFEEFNGATVPTTFVTFQKLNHLNLANNGFTAINSLLFRPLTVLRQLDLSCNELTKIDYETFVDMPASLYTLNMNFCPKVPYTDATAPTVDTNAFSGLKNVSSLSLANGFLRETVLRKLDVLPQKHLELLNLDNNGIRVFVPTHLASLEIRALSLRSNQMQKMLPKNSSFANGNWHKLTSLNLNNNQITSIEEDDMLGLSGLTELRLENNGLIRVFSGAFDHLTGLTSLFMGGNQLTTLHHFFDKIGSNIQMLAFEENRIKRLSRKDFSKMTKLVTLYLHENPIKHIEQGTFDAMDHEKMTVSLFHTNLTCDCSNSWLKGYVNDHRFQNFFTFTVVDPEDPVDRRMAWSHVPKCKLQEENHFVTEPFQCLADANSAQNNMAANGFFSALAVLLTIKLFAL